MHDDPTFYFSGLDRVEYLSVLSREGGAGMVSAAHALSPGLLRATMETYREVPLVLDSGLRKSHTLEDYADLIAYLSHHYPGRYRWYASYDVLGDQEASEEQYRTLTSILPEVRHDILWLYQARWLPRAERLRRLERLALAARQHTLVGIGGMVPIIQGGTAHALTILQEIGEVLLSSYPTRAHVFGVSSPDLLLWLRAQPWLDSVDSSRWLAGWKGREIICSSGEQRKARALGIPLTAEECGALNVRSMRGWLDPCATPALALPGMGQSDLPPASAASQAVLARLLVRYQGRSALFTSPPPSPRERIGLYLPLFAVYRREYGLIPWGESGQISPASEFCVIWDVQPGDPKAAEGQEFLMDGRPKTGLYSHDEHPMLTSLCHYPLHLALAVAKALVPC
jgi:hypothetical protein